MDDASSAHPPGGGAARGSVRVVVADDSAGMRALLRAQLGTVDGVRIVGVAADGAEAVEQAVREVPDLVLLDIAMPTMDGLEATAEIRRRLPTAKIVVLLRVQRGEDGRPRAGRGGGCLPGEGRPHR